uniref:t-SNARE coiled-coil homology domain-containing protein n=1 Tax=Macrostomum lignano TaxID=282301 RepID=A0A1I8FA01_9PLAT
AKRNQTLLQQQDQDDLDRTSEEVLKLQKRSETILKRGFGSWTIASPRPSALQQPQQPPPTSGCSPACHSCHQRRSGVNRRRLGSRITTLRLLEFVSRLATSTKRCRKFKANAELNFPARMEPPLCLWCAALSRLLRWPLRSFASNSWFSSPHCRAALNIRPPPPSGYGPAATLSQRPITHSKQQQLLHLHHHQLGPQIKAEHSTGKRQLRAECEYYGAVYGSIWKKQQQQPKSTFVAGSHHPATCVIATINSGDNVDINFDNTRQRSRDNFLMSSQSMSGNVGQLPSLAYFNKSSSIRRLAILVSAAAPPPPSCWSTIVVGSKKGDAKGAAAPTWRRAAAESGRTSLEQRDSQQQQMQKPTTVASSSTRRQCVARLAVSGAPSRPTPRSSFRSGPLWPAGTRPHRPPPACGGPCSPEPPPPVSRYELHPYANSPVETYYALPPRNAGAAGRSRPPTATVSLPRGPAWHTDLSACRTDSQRLCLVRAARASLATRVLSGLAPILIGSSLPPDRGLTISTVGAGCLCAKRSGTPPLLWLPAIAANSTWPLMLALLTPSQRCLSAESAGLLASGCSGRGDLSIARPRVDEEDRRNLLDKERVRSNSTTNSSSWQEVGGSSAAASELGAQAGMQRSTLAAPTTPAPSPGRLSSQPKHPVSVSALIAKQAYSTSLSRSEDSNQPITVVNCTSATNYLQCQLCCNRLCQPTDPKAMERQMSVGKSAMQAGPSANPLLANVRRALKPPGQASPIFGRLRAVLASVATLPSRRPRTTVEISHSAAGCI